MANRKKNKAVTIRMTEAEKEIFDNQVKKSGLSQNEFFIKTATGKEIKTSENADALKLIAFELGKTKTELNQIGNNVNQIAKNLNSGIYIGAEKELKYATIELKKLNNIYEKIFENSKQILYEIKKGDDDN